MTHRTKPANPVGDRGHAPYHPALAEFFKPPEFGHAEKRVPNLALVIEFDDDLAMPLKTGYRIDNDGFRHGNFPLFLFFKVLILIVLLILIRFQNTI